MQHALIAVIVILVLLVIVLAVLLGIFIGRHYFCHCHHHHCEAHIGREQREQRAAEEEEHDEGTTHVLNQHNDANDVVIGSDFSALRERRQQRWEQEHLQDERNSHEEYNDLESHEVSNDRNREINDLPISSQHHNNNSGSNNVDIANRLEMHNHEPTLISATSDIINTNNNVLLNNRHSANSLDHINSPTNNNELHSDDDDDDDDEREAAMATRYSPVELTGVAIENRIRPRSHLPKGTVVVEHDDRQYIIHFSEIEEIPQAAPPPLSAEELSFIEAARHRVASPEFYGRAEYLHGSHCGSIKGLPLRRRDSAASVTSLSAYDSNVDNMNKSINRSNYHVNGNNNVHEGNASMTSECYKAWHALHAPYFYNKNNGDTKSVHGASSNGSIASLANYSFRPASQAGSLYRADDSSSSHHSKEYKYNANANKANYDYNYNKDEDEERKRLKENDAVNEENFTIPKENNMNDKSKANEFCVSHNDKQTNNSKVKGPSTIIDSYHNEGDDEEDGYKSSCSEDDSQRAQDAFMRHQQMRVAYYTDPARHQRMTNSYNTKHYNTDNSNKGANNKMSGNNIVENNSDMTEEIHANDALQESLGVSDHKSKPKNNERVHVNRQQERRKRHDAYESTSDDMEEDDDNNSNVEQMQRAQLLRRQQRRQTQQKEQHSLTSSRTLKAQEAQQNNVEAKSNDCKMVINNSRCSQDADNKYRMTIIAPMLNDGNNITNNDNRYSINNQKYVLPLTALGLEQIANYTTDHNNNNDATTKSKEFTVSSVLRTSELKSNVQHENKVNMCVTANKVQQDNMESDTLCAITKTAVVPLSEVIIMHATKEEAAEPSLSCSTLSATSLTNNALPANMLIQGAQVDDNTPPNAKSINHADLSIAPAEKDKNTYQ